MNLEEKKCSEVEVLRISCKLMTYVRSLELFGRMNYEMISYPYFFESDNNLIMLYNDNGFGKIGIGYAIWK